MPTKQVRKSTRKTVSRKSLPTDSSQEMTLPDNLQQRRPNIRLIFIVAAVVLIGYYFRDWFVAAMVNNRVITRIEVINELEKQAGKQALDSLVTKSLIQQEAKKRSIVISQKEIDNEIAKIEKQLKGQGQSLDEVLAAQGSTRKDVIEQTRMQLILEKILKDKIAITQVEIDKTFAQEKANFPKDTQEAQIRAQIESSLKSQKFSTEVQKFLKEIQDKASIRYIKKY